MRLRLVVKSFLLEQIGYETMGFSWFQANINVFSRIIRSITLVMIYRPYDGEKIICILLGPNLVPTESRFLRSGSRIDNGLVDAKERV